MDVTLIVSPGRAGYNEVNLYYFDSAGLWASVDSVEVRFTYLDFSSGTVVERTPPLHAGHVLLQGAQLRHPGRWRIEALFTGPQVQDALVSFQVLVP
jgi:hypothetical protein